MRYRILRQAGALRDTVHGCTGFADGRTKGFGDHVGQYIDRGGGGQLESPAMFSPQFRRYLLGSCILCAIYLAGWVIWRVFCWVAG